MRVIELRMGTCSEIEAALADAAVALNGAFAAAESLSTHGILPSRDFERLVGFLHDVQTSLDRAQHKAAPKLTIVK